MDATFLTALRLGDNALILGQRLSNWVSRAPNVELDIAFGNLSLDLIGQANLFYEQAGKIEGKGRSADDFAYLRAAHEFFNIQMVELPNGDFARTMLRQFFYASWAQLVFEQMKQGPDAGLAAIAEKAAKEMSYHVRHSGEWVVRLGDGTNESHRRCEQALEFLWPYTSELFAYDEVDRALVVRGILPDADGLKKQWLESVEDVFSQSGLQVSETGWQPGGGRAGVHSEHFSYLLDEMQSLVRSHPGAQW